jgi:hypothetical protein
MRDLMFDEWHLITVLEIQGGMPLEFLASLWTEYRAVMRAEEYT